MTEMTIKQDTIKDVIKNREYNETIQKYYWKYARELTDKWELEKKEVKQTKLLGKEVKKQKWINEAQTIRNKKLRLEECNRFWIMDKYEKQQIKDLVSQNLCKDKFCSNCKKVIQSARMGKYIPAIEPYQNNLYHLTLTIPSVKGHELRPSIKKMNKSFKALIEILRGDKKRKISGIDLDYGYEGAIRSLEITFKKHKTDMMFHPHFHVAIAFTKIKFTSKKFTNDYSFKFGQHVKSFTYQEILIQKIWYLLFTGEAITKSKIDNLTQGYSCNLDKFQPDQYQELFKYLTKDKDQQGSIIDYETFKVLYKATFRLKQIQGYGVFYQITDTVDLDSLEEGYALYIEQLQKIEYPQKSYDRPGDLLTSKYHLISRKSYFRHLQSI